MGICKSTQSSEQSTIPIRSNPLWKNDYTGEQKIFAQSNGMIVYKIRSKLLSQDVVLKVYTKEESDLDIISHEIEILCKLDHPSIISLFDFFQDRTQIILVYEFFESQPMPEYLKTIDTGIKKNVFDNLMLGMISAVNHLHCNGIAHRNIYFDNFTIIEGKVQLMGLLNGDFFKKENSPDFKFKPWKLSKQSLLCSSPQELNKSYDQRSDIWALGVLFYVLVFGTFPFNGETEKDLILAIKSGNFDRSVMKITVVSEDLKALICKMLEVCPEKRINFPEIINSSYFSKCDDKTTFTKLKWFKILIEKPALSIFIFRLKIYMLVYFVGKHFKKSIYEVFLMFDIQKRGLIDFHDFTIGYKKFDEVAPEETILNAFQKLDLEKIGIIKVTPFLAFFYDNNAWFKGDASKKLLNSMNIEFQLDMTLKAVFKVLGCSEIDNGEFEMVKAWVQDSEKLTPQDFDFIVTNKM